MDPGARLSRLWARSEFRRGIHLTAAERAELRSIGLDGAVERSRALIAGRLGPAEPANDGRQTPWHGFPAFPAQHATATCCRACLRKHHGIAAGTALTGRQLDYVLACLRLFWERELLEELPCECRRCRPGRPQRSPAPPPVPELALSFDGAGPEEGENSEAAAEEAEAADGAVTTGYNDIDLRRWKEYPQIETGSLWIIPVRDRSGGHRLDYHGNFVPQIATQTFLRFTRRDEVVLDLFLGSGTSAIEAARLGRRCIGVELKPELAEAVRGKLEKEIAAGRIAVLEGDSRTDATRERVQEQLAAWGNRHAQLLVLHPPYHDIIAFSDRAEDLSRAPSTEAYLEMFAGVARQGYAALQPGRFAVLVIGDRYARGELVPLGFRCMEAMNRAGFRTRSIVVKNIEGNEVGKGRASNLWRYRALRGGFYIFKHEYVILFQKPGR